MKIGFLLLFFSSCAFGQISTVMVSVLHKKDDQPVENVFVKLLEGDSLIRHGSTDEKGSVKFTIQSDTSKFYTVVVNKNGFYENPPFHFIPEIKEGKITTVILEVHLFQKNYNEDLFAFTPCYFKNEYKTYSRFSDSTFVAFMNEYPQLCLEFVYSARKGERKGLKRKRTKTFKRHIKQLIDDPKRVNFSKDILYEEPFCQGCFQARVISMEGCD